MTAWTCSALMMVACLSAATPIVAQGPAADTGTTRRSTAQEAPRPWYQRLSVRGYAQVRYNRLLETNRDLKCAQCDRSIGENGGFAIRRGRLVVSGDVSNRVSVYIQPDFATDVGTTQFHLQLRDAYFDLYVDSARSHRLRMGVTKVPFGFENLVSSSNRLPLDRAEGLNSGVPGERDIGVFYHWTPPGARRHFRALTDSGLKSTGDYGLLAVGLYNGQSANRPEANNSLHQVARLAYPMRLANGQYVEVGIQAINGRFVLPSVTSSVDAADEYDDRRAGASVVWFAQPLGFVGEWNWGEGPEYVPATRSVEMQRLRGGYAQSMYRVRSGTQVWQPFARAQYYRGGRKTDLDARSYQIREYEAGIEWLPMTAFEFTVQYTVSDRRVADGSLTAPAREKGQLLRLQAQFNY